MQVGQQRGQQGIGARMPGRAGTEGFHRRLRTRADREQPRDAALARERTHLRVQQRTFLAQFGHLAEDEPALARHVGQRPQAHSQRAGVGVVGVVDQACATQRLLDLEPSRDRPHRLQAALHGVESRTGRHRGCRGGERIHDVVLAREAQLDRPRARRQ